MMYVGPFQIVFLVLVLGMGVGIGQELAKFFLEMISHFLKARGNK